MKKKSKKYTEEIVLGATALAALGGYIFYGSKNAKKNRKVVKSWMLKSKAEVLEKVEKMKDLDRESYENLVETVMSKYRSIKSIENKEVESIAKDLKDHWKSIEKGIKKTVKRKPAKNTKQKIKKTTKSTSKKKPSKKTTKTKK